ncbi:MAG TPA: hypothetical protein VK324_06385 [Tepidisphaeraceae bacterium]|nr:hypothetical protein [Tepidisphaeraceae bacterium]
MALLRASVGGSPGSWSALAIVSLAVLVGSVRPARAHETDQFALPPDVEFADLNPWLSQWMAGVIDRAADRVNARIDDADRRGDAPLAAVLRRPDELVKGVTAELPRSIELIDAVERGVRAQDGPGRAFAPAPADTVYRGAFSALDARALSHAFLSSTIVVDGTYVGTDKLGHFTDVGIAYYWAYVKARRGGGTEGEAVAAAVRVGTSGAYSEAGLLGLAATGQYSNADLAANYAGLLFYRNLTEPVALGGRTAPSPPLVALDDCGRWRLTDRALGGPFLGDFVTDHWDEALNPGLFEPGMRPALRRNLRKWSANVLLRRRDPATGLVRSADAFAAQHRALTTYFGTDYGHRGSASELVTIANTCFPPPPSSTPDGNGNVVAAAPPGRRQIASGERRASDDPESRQFIAVER